MEEEMNQDLNPYSLPYLKLTLWFQLSHTSKDKSEAR